MTSTTSLTDTIDLIVTAIMLYGIEPAPAAERLAQADHLGRILTEAASDHSDYQWTPVYELVAADRLEPTHALQIERNLRTLRPTFEGNDSPAARELLGALQDAIDSSLINWPRSISDFDAAAGGGQPDYFGITSAKTHWTRPAGFDRLAATTAGL